MPRFESASESGGTCACGCGRSTKIIRDNEPNGRVRGRYSRFARGHNPKPVEQGHYKWKHDEATLTYEIVHQRLGRSRGPCVDCGQSGNHWSLRTDVPAERLRQSWKGGYLLSFSLSPADYQPRCARCHRRYDAASYPTGSRHPQAKLTEADVLVIRSLYRNPAAKQRDLARQYGVSQTAIGLIQRGKNWAHVKPVTAAPDLA